MIKVLYEVKYFFLFPSVSFPHSCVQEMLTKLKSLQLIQNFGKLLNAHDSAWKETVFSRKWNLIISSDLLFIICIYFLEMWSTKFKLTA